MSNVFLATCSIYKDCAANAAMMLLKNWKILVASVAAYFIYMLSLTLSSHLGLVGGFLAGLVQIILLSYYYGWLRETVRRNKISWKGLVDFDYSMFSGVISVAFIIFICWLLLGQLLVGQNSLRIGFCIRLLIFVVFNAIPEVIYLYGHESIAAFSESFEFIKKNWIEWFAPLLILYLPTLLGGLGALLVVLAVIDPLLPVFGFFQEASRLLPQMSQIFVIPLSLIVATWFMLFRGFLFLELQSGSRRQRMYKSSQK